jgi:LCP family protein required for cell wall assembly
MPRSRGSFDLKALLRLFGVLLAWGLAFGAGSVLGFIGRSSIMSEALRIQAQRIEPQEVFADRLGRPRTSITVLVLGCDEDRYYGGPARSRRAGGILRHASRSDMMLVARMDFAERRVVGLSIPRDLLVQLPGYRTHKINAYHAIGFNQGGAERAKQLARLASEHVLGLTIDRVVVLDFNAFQEMIDLLGGVEVYVERDMKYTDRAGGLFIDLRKGRQVLDGYQAMGFVRFRKGEDDFQRQQRQREVMLAIKDRAFERWQVSPEVADMSLQVMGQAFSATEVASLALFLRDVRSEDIVLEPVPVNDGPGTGLLLDSRALAEKLKRLGLERDQPLASRVGE